MSDRVLEEEIRQMEARVREVHLQGDADGLARLHADDMISVNANGVVLGKASFVEAYRTGAVRDEQMESEDVTIRTCGNMAVVTMRLRLKRRHGERAVEGAFRITRVWVMENERSQVAVTQSTRTVE